MARPRKPWSHSVGRYGATVTIREPRPGAPLRWDYREGGKRKRPEVDPRTVVRTDPDGPVDPVLAERAKDLCERKAATLTLEPLRRATEPERLTVGLAFALYHDPRRRALPASREARTHHATSRTFWTAALGDETPWDAVPPADVWGALLGLREKGRVPTAEKRLANLRTLYRWLRDRMGYDTLRDPTRGLEKRQLLAGHQPRRPRYTATEVEALVASAPAFGERFALFTTLLADSGARAVQVRLAMRSGLDAELEPRPPKDHAPHGWLVLPAVKGQDPMVTYLTHRERAAVDAALATYLAEWEAQWQAEQVDYPLIPGGRTDRMLLPEPISDKALRKVWPALEKAAGIESRSRRTFHGVRRSWSDDIEESEGLDTVTAAGGWSRRETVEGIYLSKRRFGHLEKARRRREKDVADAE